ncbi:uncharacterized protein CBL_11872 [Carabus blaptoides fortunei]
MSDSDEDNFRLYGTALEPYDEDTIPKKKAFSIEDQVATDEQGRRRFHGAFTGGFSAGFFNTVGSLEGWQPSEFKSSRSEKAEKKFQKPQDFMDDEDKGQFGIAPTVVRATSDYSNTVKRKRVTNTEGPIPGMPVLHSLLQPAKDTVGIKLLKQMGWRPGQGVGPRLTKSQKTKVNREHKRNKGKVYGCEVPDEFRKQVSSGSDDAASSEDETELTFAPDDYDPFIYKPKDNTFGMGYSGLDKRALLSSHISLFNPPDFQMRDHKNSKISISGQAFGVGAFEHEDEDIYTRDDMSKYDFELDSFKKAKAKKTPKRIEQSKENILQGFVEAKNQVQAKKSFAPPVLPKNFIPKHGVRISRFEPLPETHKLYNYDRKKTMGRHDLTSIDRSKILNSSKILIEKSQSAVKALVSSTFNTSVEEDTKTLQERAAKITSVLSSTSDGIFKPFIANPDKQKRYEKYLSLIKVDQRYKFDDVQPASMTDWEKQTERREFEQAACLYRPSSGLIFDKFVTASAPDDATNPFKQVDKSIYQHGTKEMREAAKSKMFGHLTRSIDIWKPNKLLCKRFNVPEPEISESDIQLSKKKRSKYSVFDYYEAYQQNKPIKEGPEPVKEIEIAEDKELISLNTVSESESNDLNSEIVINNSTLTTVADIPLPESKIPVQSSSSNNSSQVESNISMSNVSPVRAPIHLLNQSTFVANNSQFDSDIASRSESFIKSVLKSVTVTSANVPPAQTANTVIINKPRTTVDTTINKVQQGIVNDGNNAANKIATSKSKIKLPEPTAISLPTDPKEKLDLFKAIFLSSSEDESETEEPNKSTATEEHKTEEMKKIVLEDARVTPVVNKETNKVAKGILTGLDWSLINKKTDVSSSSDSADEWMEIDVKSKEKSKKASKKHKKHKSEKRSDKSKHKKHKSKHKKKKHSDR